MKDIALRRIAAAALASSLLVLAGCSDTSTGGDANEKSDAGSDYDPTEAQAATEAVTVRPTSIGITAPIEGEIPEGIVIDYIQCGVPSCVEGGDHLEDAASAVGWTVNRIDAGLTAETIKAAWAEAVANEADAVVASGTPRALFEPELQALKAAGVPVIDQITADAAENGLTAVFEGEEDQVQVGKRLADYLLAQNNGNAFDTLTVTSPISAGLANIEAGLEERMAEVCSDCTTDALEIPPTSIGTDLPTRVTSYLSSHPDVKWVWNGFSDMNQGLPAALAAAGLSDVRVITYNSGVTSASYLENEQSVVAIDSYPATEIEWRTVDFLIRHLNGEDTEVNTGADIPRWIVTKGQVPTLDETFPMVEDYADQYKALWGVS